jgi:6-phosphofructokinase 1
MPKDGAVTVPPTDVPRPRRLAVLTSGGDAGGMNAAVRAVARYGLSAGLEVFGVYEGLQGLVDGGERIRRMSWAEVSGILQRGGTVLGTARSADFRTRDGRRRAARNLVERGIDGLVVIGGDGSLTGADTLREEWPALLEELVAEGAGEAIADAHGRLALVGLVGSIDNDMVGTDMTIGADTALHRITEAVDAIQSTASSHQRTFVVEVMGRNCGYLALMGGLATGANFVLIPEQPPAADWEDSMCRVLHAGREIGRRANIVLVAEGARDREGQPITVTHLRAVLEERLGEDARVTILGHVQRGGAPSAFDRYLGTVLGCAAVQNLLDDPGGEPQLIGIRGHRLSRSPLRQAVADTRAIADVIAEAEDARAMDMRGGSFNASYQLLRTLERSRPRRSDTGRGELRIGVLHSDEPAPGMNAAVRVAARVAMDRGHRVLAINEGFGGLAEGAIEELEWMSVSGWVSRPGAELGTNQIVPDAEQLPQIAAQIADQRLDGLLMVGGWSGYVGATELAHHGGDFPALRIPVVCVPASINNDLPASDMSIGADSALNSITSDVDKLKDSVVGSRRCFIVEVKGRDCGFLPLMAAVATGAEAAYVPEDGVTLEDLLDDVDALNAGFKSGSRLGVIIRGEHADELYTTSFIEALFSRESSDRFEVEAATLGRVLQGGRPSPFDRIQATRLASAGVEHLLTEARSDHPASAMVGLHEGKVGITPLARFVDLVEPAARRPLPPAWWTALRPLLKATSSRPQKI